MKSSESYLGCKILIAHVTLEVIDDMLKTLKYEEDAPLYMGDLCR